MTSSLKNKEDLGWSALSFVLSLVMLFSIYNATKTLMAANTRLEEVKVSYLQANEDYRKAQQRLSMLDNPRVIEEEARRDLGMIRPNETPYSVANPPEIPEVKQVTEEKTEKDFLSKVIEMVTGFLR